MVYHVRLTLRKVPSSKLGGNNFSIFHNCSMSFPLRRNSTLTKALRPRGTKTVAKAVVDAKIESLEDSSRTLEFFLFAAKNRRYLQIKECNAICSLIRVPRSVRWKRQTQP